MGSVFHSRFISPKKITLRFDCSTKILTHVHITHGGVTWVAVVGTGDQKDVRANVHKTRSHFYLLCYAESWRLNQVGVHLVPFTRRNPSHDGRRVIFAILSLWVFIYVWVNNIDDGNTMMEGVVALAFMQVKRK